MVIFDVCATLIGIAIGYTLPFAAIAVVVLAASIVVMVTCAWQGLALGQILWTVFLCQLFIEVGYAAGLMLRAFATHRRRLSADRETARCVLRGKQR